jgi:hypothetical protein
MQVVDGLERRIPRFPPVLALAVLGFGSEEPQVLFKDILDAEEDVSKPASRISRVSRSPWLAMAEVIARTVYSRSFRPASMIARQSASNRRTLSVMLSSTMKSDRAPCPGQPRFGQTGGPGDVWIYL